MKRFAYFSALSVVFLLMVACHKEKLPTILPPATQEGKNTLGFKINGRVWTPGKKPAYQCGCPDVSAEYNSPEWNPYSFGITAGRSRGSKKASFGIGSYLPIKDTGDYSDQIHAYYNDNGLYINGYYTEVDFDQPRSLIITKLDTIQHIISGTFEFTLFDPNDHSNTITITDGRFDFHY